MAREDGFEERYLEEMPSCLRDFFEQTGCKQDKCSANNPRYSMESWKSILEVSGMKLPPPLLTQEDRAKMRQYRREAVKCEARMFERRREKYSDLILQVMSVMDRIQEQREAKHGCTESVRERTLTNEIGEMQDTSRSLQHSNSRSASAELEYRRQTWDVPMSGRYSNSKWEQFTDPFPDWTENQGDQSKRVDSQMRYLPNSDESMLVTSDESRIFKHQLTVQVDSREQTGSAPLGFDGDRHDLPLSSTVDKDASEFKRPFPQVLSVASNGMFSDRTLDATPRNNSKSFQQERRGFEYDSLASTSLSVAFSDFSNATVYSVIETEPGSTAQQPPHLQSETNNTYYGDHYERQTSTAQLKNPQTNTRPISIKQKPEQQIPQSARLSKGPSLSDQDKTLANLEKLRQKLLEEKQKHLDALKQQELKRLRKQQKEEPVELDHSYASSHSITPTHPTERPRSSSTPSTRTIDFKQSPENSRVIGRSSPLRRPVSMPPGEMYSILELSGENLEFDVHDHSTEPESSSDKENHIMNGDLSVNRSSASLSNVAMRINSGQNMHLSSSQRTDHKTSAIPREGFKDDTGTRLAMPSHRRPFSECNKGNRRRLHTGYFFPSNGRDKFSKLSAQAKGFLTRLLMKTDKVQGLVKTIKDTRDVLEDMSKEDTQTMQEKILKENVESHLKVARGSLHDVFFTIPVKERMLYIAHSRGLAQAKQAKRATRNSAVQSKLSAVTLRAIQRRQEGLENSVKQTENPEVKPKLEVREERKRKNWNIRVLKPQQGHMSPPLPDRTRSKKQANRPTTAPDRPLNSRVQKEETVKRPQTAEPVRANSGRPSRVSLGGGNSNQQAKRPGRKSLGGIHQQPKMVGALTNTNRTAQPRAQKRLSLPESAQPRVRAHVGQRPQTASEVKRSARPLAANFAK